MMTITPHVYKEVNNCTIAWLTINTGYFDVEDITYKLSKEEFKFIQRSKHSIKNFKL